MTSLTITADDTLLEQIANIAENLAYRDNKFIKIQSPSDERSTSYEADAIAVKKGEIKTRSFNEFEKEMKKW